MLGSVAVAAMVMVQGAVAQQGPVDRPVLKPGSEWTYNVDASKRNKPGPAQSPLKRVIKEVGDKEITYDLITATGTRTTVMTADLNPLSEGMTSGARASAPLPFFAFPLEPGKTYGGTLLYPSPFGSVDIQMVINTKVIDWEEVTVPAGKFRALRIEVQARSSGGPINGTRSVKLWYAPEVGQYVRGEFEMTYSPVAGKTTYELMSYSLK